MRMLCDAVYAFYIFRRNEYYVASRKASRTASRHQDEAKHEEGEKGEAEVVAGCQHTVKFLTSAFCRVDNMSAARLCPLSSIPVPLCSCPSVPVSQCPPVQSGLACPLSCPVFQQLPCKRLRSSKFWPWTTFFYSKVYKVDRIYTYPALVLNYNSASHRYYCYSEVQISFPQKLTNSQYQKQKKKKLQISYHKFQRIIEYKVSDSLITLELLNKLLFHFSISEIIEIWIWCSFTDISSQSSAKQTLYN